MHVHEANSLLSKKSEQSPYTKKWQQRQTQIWNYVIPAKGIHKRKVSRHLNTPKPN